MGDLKEVVIMLSSNPKIFQVIDIVVVDIPEAYGLLLSSDQSLNINGYFSTNQSHLLLPIKEKLGYMRIDSEKDHKFFITELNMPNKDMMFCQSLLCNYCFDTYFRNSEVETLNAVESNKHFDTLHCAQTIEKNCNIVDDRKTNFIETGLSDVVVDNIL